MNNLKIDDTLGMWKYHPDFLRIQAGIIIARQDYDLLENAYEEVYRFFKIWDATSCNHSYMASRLILRSLTIQNPKWPENLPPDSPLRTGLSQMNGLLQLIHRPDWVPTEFTPPTSEQIFAWFTRVYQSKPAIFWAAGKIPYIATNDMIQQGLSFICAAYRECASESEGEGKGVSNGQD